MCLKSVLSAASWCLLGRTTLFSGHPSCTTTTASPTHPSADWALGSPVPRTPLERPQRGLPAPCGQRWGSGEIALPDACFPVSLLSQHRGWLLDATLNSQSLLLCDSGSSSKPDLEVSHSVFSGVLQGCDSSRGRMGKTGAEGAVLGESATSHSSHDTCAPYLFSLSLFLSLSLSFSFLTYSRCSVNWY